MCDDRFDGLRTHGVDVLGFLAAQFLHLEQIPIARISQPGLQLRSRVAVFDMRVEISPMRSRLHQGIVNILRNSVVLIHAALMKLDF